MMKRGTEEDQDLQLQRTQQILQGLEATPLGPPRWRISPEPFWISTEEMGFFKDLGNHLLAFYQALNTLYQQSARGRLPQWIAQYLDQGKPHELVAYGRMNRFKTLLPRIIRPDLILTEAGQVCTELDSVPGGFGMTACLVRLYSKQGFEMAGGGDGILQGFAQMIRDVADQEHPNLALVVSEESRDYLPEMAWLCEALRNDGFSAYVVEPDQMEFTEHALFAQIAPHNDGHRFSIDVIYRFFELFDLKNIPKSELILYAVKKDLVSLTPPAKTFLEEKLAFALFHHPVLRHFWLEELGKTPFAVL
ncbi:MAG: H-NS histone family protein, partial [Nitrospira sp.]|nr:H-NS histone family protein [Nitrospira sp.]